MSTPQKSNSSSSKQKKWRPDVSSEARKLGNNEDDWNLASAGNQLARRTRASTSSAPPIVRPLQLQQEPRQLFDLDDTRGDDNSTALSSLTDDNSALSRSRKPTIKRRTTTRIQMRPTTRTTTMMMIMTMVRTLKKMKMKNVVPHVETLHTHGLLFATSCRISTE